MLRIKRICTDHYYFIEVAKGLFLNLFERSYAAKDIRVFNIT
jgi:hypothetical protein